MLNSTDFPVPGIIVIEDEKIRYNNITDREFIECERGYKGTDAVAHAKGELVTFDLAITDPIIFQVNGEEKLRIDESGVKVAEAYLLPSVDGDVGQVIKTDGDGVTTWEDVA